MSRLVFDESLVSQLEAVYRTRDVLRRRALVREALGAEPGERILDAGCGPGFYMSELLDRIGPDGFIMGVDASPQMLAVAAGRCEGHENVGASAGRASARVRRRLDDGVVALPGLGPHRARAAGVG